MVLLLTLLWLLHAGFNLPSLQTTAIFRRSLARFFGGHRCPSNGVVLRSIQRTVFYGGIVGLESFLFLPALLTYELDAIERSDSYTPVRRCIQVNAFQWLTCALICCCVLSTVRCLVQSFALVRLPKADLHTMSWLFLWPSTIFVSVLCLSMFVGTERVFGQPEIRYCYDETPPHKTGTVAHLLVIQSVVCTLAAVDFYFLLCQFAMVINKETPGDAKRPGKNDPNQTKQRYSNLYFGAQIGATVPLSATDITTQTLLLPVLNITTQTLLPPVPNITTQTLLPPVPNITSQTPTNHDLPSDGIENVKTATIKYIDETKCHETRQHFPTANATGRTGAKMAAPRHFDQFENKAARPGAASEEDGALMEFDFSNGHAVVRESCKEFRHVIRVLARLWISFAVYNCVIVGLYYVTQSILRGLGHEGLAQSIFMLLLLVNSIWRSVQVVLANDV